MCRLGRSAISHREILASAPDQIRLTVSDGSTFVVESPYESSRVYRRRIELSDPTFALVSRVLQEAGAGGCRG